MRVGSYPYIKIVHDMSVAEQFDASDSDLVNRSSCEAGDATEHLPFSNSGDATNLPFLAAILSSLVFGALLLVLVSRSWASAPYWDQWGYEADPLIRYFSTHTLTLQELFSQHNESRLFVPRITTLLYAPLTGWDVRFEVGLSVLAVLLVSIGIHILILRNTILTAGQKIVCIILASGIILQTTQWEVLLFGAYYFVIPGLAIVWSLVVAGNRWRFPIKVLAWSALSLFATLSYINGVILWVLLLPCLVLESRRASGSKIRNRLWALLYPILGVITVILYFHGYQHPPTHPTAKATFAEPLRMINYFLYWIGPPAGHFSLPLSFAACCGAALLLMFLVPAAYLLAIGRSRYDVQYFYSFLIIGVYALLTGLSITFGRSGFGATQAFSSRYQTFSLLLPAIVFPLFFIAAEINSKGRLGRREQWVQGITLLIGAVGMLFAMSFVNSVPDLQAYGKARHKAELVVAYSTVIPDNPGIALADPFPADVVRVCRALAPFHLPHITVGADRVVAAAKHVSLLGDPSNGFLDAVADTPNSLAISGWAILKKTQKPADAVLIEWSGVNGNVKPIAILAVGTPREDVASLYGNDDLSASGFAETISKANIPGPGVISAWAVNQKTHVAYELATTRNIGTPPGS
jgi:hypothetical protein